MKKHLKKLRPLLLLTTLFLLTNCQEEFEENKAVVQQKNGSKHTILTGEAARAKKAELLIKLNKDGGKGLSKLQNVLKGGSTDPAFRQLMDIKEYIDDNEVYSIEQANGNVNNTFRVNMPDAGDNKFYNLVVKTAGTASKTVLLTYNLSKEFAEEYQNGGDILHFSGEIEFDILAIDEDFPCEEEPGKPTPVSGGSGSGGGGGGGGTGGGGTGGGGIGGPGNPGDPGVPYNQSLVDQKFQHLKFMAVINWGGDEEWELVSRSPRYFRTGKVETGDIDNLCGDAEDIGVLDPAIKNCEELAKMSNNIDLINALKNLDSKTKELIEYGYAIEKNSGNYNVPQIAQSDPQTPNMIRMGSYLGGDYIGLFHTHPDPFDGVYPMFSGADIGYLFYVAVKHNNNNSPKNYSDYFITLTTIHGTYALKFNNFAKLSIFINGKGIAAIDQVLYPKYDARQPEDSVDNLIVELLTTIKDLDLGVSLYEANKDLTDWAEIQLNDDPLLSGYPLKSIPCK
jgi:hypothetical protein